MSDKSLDPSRLPSASAALTGATLAERLRQARPRLLRIAHTFGLPPDVAEDIAQDTSLRAWRGLADLRDTSHFDSWLNTICRNQCRMYLRAQRRAPAALSLPTASDEAASDQMGLAGAELADPLALDPLEAVGADDAALLLEQAFAYLAPQDRAALDLRYMQGLPLAEAADALGVTSHVLEARLSRARAHLRATLAGPLRGAAVDFGLDMPRDDAWRATRISCYLCGRRKLLGRFETAVNGCTELRLRCPTCSAPDGGDIFRSKGIAPLDGLQAFRPALTRSLRALAARTQRTLASGYDVCLHCGDPAPRRIASAEEFPADLSHAQHRRLWVVAPCARPGCPGLGAWTALDAVIGAEPVAQRFIADHPRWVTTPDASIAWQGRSAIRFHLRDAASAAQLTVVADHSSLHVLATY